MSAPLSNPDPPPASIESLDLSTHLATLTGVIPGLRPQICKSLEGMGLSTIGKLIAHLPIRHERIEAETTIDQLTVGHVVCTRGEITNTRELKKPRTAKPRFQAALEDDTGRVDLLWFNQPWLNDRIIPGMRIRVQGLCGEYMGAKQIVGGDFQVLAAGDEPATLDHDELRPVYPATQKISSAQIERVISAIIKPASKQIEDHLPAAFCKAREMPSLSQAYLDIHSPPDEPAARHALRRLSYDELLMLQLGVHMKRAHLRGLLTAPALRWSPQIDSHIRKLFPFTFTNSQDEVLKDVISELSAGIPANRLVQGDVGAGKTVIAVYAMLMAAASGHQAALMAPTEILAEQHMRSITKLLAHSKLKVALLLGGTPPKEKKAILKGLSSDVPGERVDLLIGTHALLTESVKFRSLAVAVIDEQHRFGVAQRARLRASSTVESDSGETVTPHVLVMTATPIPRTLAITLFGDLDISTIKSLPPGRKSIITRVVGHDKRPTVYQFVRERLEAGDQAYIISPSIEDSDEPTRAELSSVKSLMEELSKGPLAGLEIAALHGRLKRETQESIMQRFRAGEIRAIVSTTVIEVGVDIPNATIMVIENADRFGLAQLHQLRGRVGRGDKQSVCALVSNSQTADAEKRLGVMAQTTDGFKIAEADFDIRGPGEIFGTRQAGIPPFKVADLHRDKDLLMLARKDAAEWIRNSPTLSRPDEALLLRRLLMRYGQSLGLGDVG